MGEMDDILFRAVQHQNLSIKKSQIHYRYAAILERRNVWLGIPVSILSSIVGTTIFASLADKGFANTNLGTIVVICGGLVSFLASIMSGLQTFLGFAESSAKHRTCGAAYESVRRALDIFALQFSRSNDREVALKSLIEITDRLDSIASTEPTIPQRLYDNFKWRTAAETDIMYSRNTTQQLKS